MRYLVDASVAVKWFIQSEIHHKEANAFLYAFGGDLEAPDIIMAEVANVLWKKHLRGEIDDHHAREAILETRDYIDAFHFSANFIDRALDLAMELGHPVYDCVYLACAEATDRTLITADARLHHQLKETSYETLVELLEDRKEKDWENILNLRQQEESEAKKKPKNSPKTDKSKK